MFFPRLFQTDMTRNTKIANTNFKHSKRKGMMGSKSRDIEKQNLQIIPSSIDIRWIMFLKADQNSCNSQHVETSSHVC